MQHTIQFASFNATARIIALVAPFIPASERESLWGRIYLLVKAGIVATGGMDRLQERLSPSKK